MGVYRIGTLAIGKGRTDYRLATELMIMKRAFLFLVGIALLATGALAQQQDPNISDEQRQEGIAKFKTDVMTLVDSSNYYFDQVVESINSGSDPKEVSTTYQPALQRLAKAIDSRLRQFQREAYELDLTEESYDRANLELMRYLSRLKKRHREVADLGFRMH